VPTTWSYRRALLLYAILPLGVSLVLVAMYFSGSSWMQAFVAPDFNREFGALETLQHLALLATALLLGRLAWKSTLQPERALFVVGALGMTFILLEELDYGLHFYEALAGIPESERAAVRNVHNLKRGSGDELADLMKRAADVVMVLYFCVLPFARHRVKRPRLRAFVPSRWSFVLLAGTFLVSRLAHYLDDAGHGAGGSLTKAIGEFRELGVYVLWFLYVLSLRPACAADEGGPESEALSAP